MPLKCPYCWRCFRYSLSRDMHIKDDHRIISGRCPTGQADGTNDLSRRTLITYILGTTAWPPISDKHLQLTRKQNQYSNRRRTSLVISQHHQNSQQNKIHTNQNTDTEKRPLFYYGREEQTNADRTERDQEREIDRQHRNLEGQRGQRGQSEEDSPGSTDSCDSEQNTSAIPNSDAAIRVSVIVKNPFITN